MIGSEEASYVLREISQVKLATIWSFYGTFDLTNRFTFLSITQLNDRPRFKMSELVEVDECSVSGIGQCPYELKSGRCTFYGHCTNKTKSLQTTELKEVFTGEFLWNEVISNKDDLDDIATKLNQMAFDAYKNK